MKDFKTVRWHSFILTKNEGYDEKYVPLDENGFVSLPIPKILPNSSNHSPNLTTGERLRRVSSDDHNRLEKAFGRVEVSGSGIKKCRSLFRYMEVRNTCGFSFRQAPWFWCFWHIFSDHPLSFLNRKYLFTISS